MAWFNNSYACECGAEWDDQHCCGCDDECPECGAAISPHESAPAREQGSCGDADCPDCAREEQNPLERVGPFNVRMVFTGDRYGRRDSLTHEGERPMIEFYDTRHPDPDAPERGQFVSRYYLATLASDARRRGVDVGLDMHGGVPSWKLTGAELSAALMFAAEQVRNREG